MYAGRLAGAICLALTLVAGGCTHQTQRGHFLQGAAVENVPFFPQTRNQCGPAALATVLNYSGVLVTPEELAGQVYVPGLNGSLQIELKSSARLHGRLPYEIEPELQAIVRELEAGRPVLVLQNLAFAWAPRWHYAVVVGYDEHRKQILLNSGPRERRRQRVTAFQRSWRLADNWGMVVLSPGELAAAGSASRYLKALSDSRSALGDSAYELAVLAGLARWSKEPNLLFAAGNHALERGEDVAAAALYKRAIESDPTHVGALNNYAEVLKRNSCFDQAAVAAETALQHAEQSGLRDQVLATALEVNSLRSSRTPERPQLCYALGS